MRTREVSVEFTASNATRLCDYAVPRDIRQGVHHSYKNALAVMALFVALTKFVPYSGAQGTLSTMILEAAPYPLLDRTYHARRGVQAEHEVRDIT